MRRDPNPVKAADQTTAGAPVRACSDAPPQTEIASLRRRLEFRRLLSEVSTYFINLPAEEIDKNINRALGQVGSFLGFNLVAISKFSPQDKAGEVTHIWTAEGMASIPPGFTHMDFPWVAGRLMEGRPVHLASLDDLPQVGQRDRRTYERLGIQTAYNWPLQVAGASIGCLGLCCVGARRFFPVEFEEELELLAQVLASAFDRQRADLALRESEARLDLAADAASVGLWRLNLATSVYWLTNKTRELFGLAANEEVSFERFLGLIHPDDRELVRRSVETVVESRNQGVVEYRVVRSDENVRWMFSRGRVHANPSGEPKYLTGVSVDITERKQAEATLRNLSGRLIAAQEQERSRLARELHDGLSQNLAWLAVELELMGQRPPTDPAEIPRRLQELSAQMKKLSSEVHRISHDLHPAKLTQLGLTTAIAELCQAPSSDHHLLITFDHNAVPRSLPPGVALCLYRVAQESIQNAVRHSAAKNVRVEMTIKANEIYLGVADDGRGFAVESTRTTSTLGLVSMRERVRLVHGQMGIESKPGEGTRVSVRIPLTKGTES